MFLFISYLTLISLSLIHTCDIFVGMTCTCYESIDLRCTMSKLAPLQLITPTMKQTFQSIDIKFQSDENINLNQDYFILLNNLLANTSQQSLSITLRFQNFYSFRAQTGTFRNLFKDLTNSYTRLTIELHPLRAKSILFERNTFDYLQVNELSIYADALTSSFESIFNNTNITHLNIEGAIVVHDPSLTSKFTGQIRSLKMTRMIDSVNSDEFPSFPVQSYTIEAHKMRRLDAYSFVNYTQLTGLNIIQPDVSITSRVLRGLEYLTNLHSISLDAERIADGALKYVKHIQTLTLGSYLKMLDTESINSLTSLQQLDIRYVQFSSLQANTSCTLADFINRRRMLGLTVYLPMENPECDCILVFLNNMIDNGDQLIKCQSIDNDRCVFSSCPIVSEYFTRKQRENQPVKVNNIQPSVVTPSILPPVIDFNEQDSPFYPDSKEEERKKTTIKVVMEPSIYDDFEEEVILNLTARTTILPPPPPPSSSLPSSPSSSSSISTNPTTITTTTTSATTTTTTSTTTTTTVEITTTPFLIDPEDSDNDFSTPYMKRLQTELKSYGSANYLIVSWIPFAIIASCLFLSLVIAMIGYIIYHKRRTVSFKLVPQTAPII